MRQDLNIFVLSFFFAFLLLLARLVQLDGEDEEASKVQSGEEINILLWKVLRDTISFWLRSLLPPPPIFFLFAQPKEE